MEASALLSLFDMNYLKRTRKFKLREKIFPVHTVKAGTAAGERSIYRSGVIKRRFDGY